MALSRRQFFRRFLGPDKVAQRQARYADLEAYTRTHLIPYDFPLTPDQESTLMSEVREMLERATDEALFSHGIYRELDQVGDRVITPWREASDVDARAQKLREVRQAAPDYVHSFLSIYSSDPVIDHLKETYQVQDIVELESVLKRQIEIWISETNDRLIQHYDVLSVQDLVFAQLRSWC